MSDNGNEMDLVKVSLVDGKMKTEFGPVNIALISHAVRIVNLHVDNMIIQLQQEKESPLIKTPLPPDLMDRLRGKK